MAKEKNTDTNRRIPKYIDDDEWDIIDLFHGMAPDLIPTKGSSGAAGYDLRASCDGVIFPDRIARVPTGVRVNIPTNHVGLVCSRSGLAYNHGIFVVNSPGVIDEDYEGEIVMILGQLATAGVVEPFKFVRGDRLAQLLIIPIFDKILVTPPLAAAATTTSTTKNGNSRRGENGFGSSGIS